LKEGEDLGLHAALLIRPAVPLQKQATLTRFRRPETGGASPPERLWEH
jgi:hypothetical protein